MKKTTSFIFLLSVGLLWACTNQKQEAPAKPNILFIMSDDHTSQAWGIYGGILKDYVINENIARLADEGAVLNNAFCTNSICVPSRASILTGQYSHRNGVYTLVDAMEPDSMNIAKALKHHGYQTAVIGKWHLKKQPSGFDHFMVLPGQGRYHDPILKTKENWEDGYKGGKEYKGFSADVIADFSIDWLKNADKDKPFFLMTHFKATHEPFDYPERLKDLYKDQEIPEPESLYDFGPETNGRTFTGQKMDELARRMMMATKNPDKFWTSYPGLPFSTEGLDSIQARKKIYQKFIKDFMRCGASIDENIGRLLDYLEESGQAENTVVIYTADQGYFLGEHGFFDKRMIYEESSRMPFVIRYPKEIKGGTRIDDIILNTDFASLFADYAGIGDRGFGQGRSFRQNLKGNTPTDWRESMYYRYWAHAPRRPGHFGIRTHRYKLIFFYGNHLGLRGAEKQENTEPAWEFFDLEKDPYENHNAYNDPAYTEIIKELKEALLKQKEVVGDSDAQYAAMEEVMQDY
ncbi:sulfatase [Fulvivirgaceae bacterium BMA10]|uniref:Sulfatase n=1 Tax=Splendidivirga corallicola TaxID=3051826 RepID=A0ABT8KUW6_9BACT|nr:sulfatase [Fulvivirgaceae bacterium BMA10]